MLGGGAAMALFAFAGLVGGWFTGTAGGDQAAALFGSFAIGTTGYIAVASQIVLIAAVTAWTARQTVNRTLETIE